MASAHTHNLIVNSSEYAYCHLLDSSDILVDNFLQVCCRTDLTSTDHSEKVAVLVLRHSFDGVVKYFYI